MSTNTHTQQVNGTTDEAPNWPVFAALGSSAAAVLTAIGSFVDVFGPKEDRPDGMGPFYEWLTLVGVIVVMTALIFGLVVRRATPANASNRGLVMAIIAVPTVIVAWSGLPPVLSAAALACTVVARRGRGRFSRQDKTTLALTTLAMAGAIAFALAGCGRGGLSRSPHLALPPWELTPVSSQGGSHAQQEAPHPHRRGRLGDRHHHPEWRRVLR
jgi:hypothetical protein